MKVEILKEEGYDEAMLGLSLSYNRPVNQMGKVARKLIKQGGSHVKFLESMCVWLDITAPRYWWQQFDTYRCGVTKQSESTMHTILRGELSAEDFECRSAWMDSMIVALNGMIADKRFEDVKACLPESFRQRRIVCTNYKALSHIYWQRHDHRLIEWTIFCGELEMQLERPYFITEAYSHE